jgi:hypothetical protein
VTYPSPGEWTPDDPPRHRTPDPNHGGYPHHPQGYPQPQAERGDEWPPPMRHPRNGFGITSLVLALLGLLFCLMPITGFLGLGLGLIGTLFGALGLGRVRKREASNRKLTVAGLVLSLLAVVFGFLSMKMFFDIVDDFGGPSTAPTAVTGAPPGAAPIPPPPASDESPQEFAAGQTVDRDGLQITAAPLQRVKQSYGPALLCTDVKYLNNSGEEVNYNGGFDWTLQDPDSNIAAPTYGGDKTLSSGALAPGGKVGGRVCFADPKLKGDYLIINEQIGSTSAAAQARWRSPL